MVKTKIAVLVSGGGTNLQALLDAQQSGLLTDGEIVLVIASNAKAYALTRAAQAGVPAVVCSRKELGSQAAFEAAISQALADHGVELIVLAGFMSILSEDFTRRCSTSGVSPGSTSTAFWRRISPPSGTSLTKWTVAPVTFTP